MTEQASEPKILTPYVPFKTFTSFISSLKETAVPPVIDTSILTSMSGSVRGQLMSTLKFLRLVDSSGTVSEQLKTLVSNYSTGSWADALGSVINDAYADVIGDVHLDKGTPAQLQGAFKSRGNVDGQMLEKSIRFFLTAMKEVGATISPHFTKRKPRKYKPRSKPKKKDNGSQINEDPPEDEDLTGMAKFRLPIPGKSDCLLYLPGDIDQDDWDMLKIQLDAYVARLIK